MINKPHSYETPVPLFHFPLSRQVFGIGAAGTFWTHSRFFSNKNLDSEAKSFHSASAPQSTYRTSLQSHVFTRPHGLPQTGQSTAWTVLMFRQQHGQLPGCSVEKQLFCSHRVFKLTPTKANCFRDIFYQYFSNVPRQHLHAFSYSGLLWLPWQFV